jgi:hypothetical protein
MPRFKPQELANVLWAMAVLNMKLPQVCRGQGGGGNVLWAMAVLNMKLPQVGGKGGDKGGAMCCGPWLYST